MTTQSPIILGQHETEKAIAAQTVSVYTFRVAPTATKLEIKKAVVKTYQVKPRQLRIVNVPRKRLIYRGHPAWKSGYKKVMVYLKAGEKIDFKSKAENKK